MVRLLRYFLLSSLLLSPLARATTMIYPVEAIDDPWNLPADEFRAKYAGINITGLGPSDEGWYVRYKHENLTCLFGPLADREEARSKKWDMEAVRDAVIRNKPSLASSQVDFVRFTFSGVYGKGGGGNSANGGPQRARVSADGKSGPDGDLDGDGIVNSKDPDMDGDGIPNEKDGDVDGDGIPNGADDYGFGKDPGVDGYGNGVGDLAKDGSGSGNGDGKDGEGSGNDGNGSGKDGKGGKGGKGGKDGNGNGGDGQVAGGDGSSDGQGGGSQGGQSGSSGGQGGGSDGSSGSSGGQRGGRQVASNQRGGSSGGGQGQSGGQAGQAGQSGSQGGSSGGSQGGGGGAAGGGPGGTPGSGSSGGGGNPLSLLAGLLKKILGI